MMADPTAKRWYDGMQKGGAAGVAAKKEAVSAQANHRLPKVFMVRSAFRENVSPM